MYVCVGGGLRAVSKRLYFFNCLITKEQLEKRNYLKYLRVCMHVFVYVCVFLNGELCIMKLMHAGVIFNKEERV